jgi:hypothetical protein
MYYETFAQIRKMLGQMDKWFDAALAHAGERKFDVDVLTGCRLAPDQFALSRQVQIACDTAKLGASRLTGKEAPAQADTEKSIEELRSRVRSVIAYLEGITPEDFQGAATRQVSQPRWEGKHMLGADYFMEHAVPNFFFHVSHVYAILRHNGVPLGKRDYLGPLSLKA